MLSSLLFDELLVCFQEADGVIYFLKPLHFLKLIPKASKIHANYWRRKIMDNPVFCLSSSETPYL